MNVPNYFELFRVVGGIEPARISGSYLDYGGYWPPPGGWKSNPAAPIRYCRLSHFALGRQPELFHSLNV